MREDRHPFGADDLEKGLPRVGDRDGSTGGTSGLAPDEGVAGWPALLGSLRRLAANNVGNESLQLPLRTVGDRGSAPEGDPWPAPGWVGWAWMAASRAQERASVAQENLLNVDWNEQVVAARDRVSVGFEKAKTLEWTDQVVAARDRVSVGLERAKTVEWTDQAHGIQRHLSRSWEAVSTGASSATSSLGDRLGELSHSDGVQHLRESTSSAASAVAGAARNSISATQGAVQTAASLTMNPLVLAKFVALLLIGGSFIMLSFGFLPVMVVKPAAFAMPFTLGSMILMSSFMILSSPQAFLAHATEEHKLPFTAAYAIGLLGTLWATIIRRSYVFTLVFALVQAGALAYFLASHLPGATSALNSLGRVAGRSARTLAMG